MTQKLVPFEGNPGLCGIQLSKKCEDFNAFEEDWRFLLAGCISGFVVGVALGDMVITKSRGWFLKAFRRIPPRKKDCVAQKLRLFIPCSVYLFYFIFQVPSFVLHSVCLYICTCVSFCAFSNAEII